MRAIVGACSICVCLVAMGCGDDGLGACPDMSGVWNIVEHCEPSVQGGTVTLTQSGCNIVYAAPFAGWTGTIAESGAMTGVGPGGSMNCTGTLSGGTVTLTCNPACNVKLQR